MSFGRSGKPIHANSQRPRNPRHQRRSRQFVKTDFAYVDQPGGVVVSRRPVSTPAVEKSPSTRHRRRFRRHISPDFDESDDNEGDDDLVGQGPFQVAAVPQSPPERLLEVTPSVETSGVEMGWELHVDDSGMHTSDVNSITNNRHSESFSSSSGN